MVLKSSMSRSKEKRTPRTPGLQVVGIVYKNRENKPVRLMDFLEAGRDLADRISAKAEEEEVERLKAENDRRVEELLAKAKDIKQRSTSENDTIVNRSETGSLEQKSKPKPEENGNVNKTEKPRSKADALEWLHRMEWKRCKDDHKDISSNLRSSNGNLEFLPLTKSKKDDDEYLCGTKVKKNREKKKNKEEIIVSLEKWGKCESTAPVSRKSPKLGHTIPPPRNTCWQKKAGAALFESADPDIEDVELKWALHESLKEQEEQQKRFMEILAGSRVETKRKPPGTMAIPPPEPSKEEDWDADHSEYTDAEESFESSKTEHKYEPEIKEKQGNKSSEAKGAGNTMSATCTTSIASGKSLGLHHNGETKNVKDVGHFNSAQQQMNKLVTNQNEKLKQKKAQSSDISRLYVPQYQIRREQAHLDRTYLQPDNLENKGNFEDESERCMDRVSETLKSKSTIIYGQKDVIKSVKQTTHHESLNHSNRNLMCRSMSGVPLARSKAKDNYLSPKMLPSECTSKQNHKSQSEVKNISQSFSALHIDTEPVGSRGEEKLTHQNSNEVHPCSCESSTLSSTGVSHSQPKTKESSAANMQHLTQTREQPSQQLSGSAVPQSICSPLTAQEVSAAAKCYQQQKQLSSQSVPGQFVKPDSYESLMEELQRIQMYQNYLMQLSAQESLQMAMQQQLQSMNTLGTSCSALTQEQQQMMFQQQLQQTLMLDVKALLQQQTQNAMLYTPVSNLLQPQYPGKVLPNPKDTAQHSQTPSIRPDSPDNVTMVRKHFQGMLQQQHPGDLLHTGFPGAGLTDKELTQKQQWDSITQPGTQASTTMHLSLQTSYPNAPQSSFAGPTQYPHPMLLQQQYAPNMHVAKPPSPQSHTGAPPTSACAAMSAAETTQYPQSILLQQQYAPNILAKPPSPQSLTGMPSSMNPTAMSAAEATKYLQSILLQQQCAPSMLASPQSPQGLTGMPSSMNPTTMSAAEVTKYLQSILLQQQCAPSMLASPQSPQSLTGEPSNMNPTAMSAMEATQYPESMLLQQQYAPNVQSLTGAPSSMNPTITNVVGAQLMMPDIYNQQPAQHRMTGVVPLLPQEKPKTKGRGRLLNKIE